MFSRLSISAIRRLRCAHTLTAPTTWGLPLQDGYLGTVTELWCKPGDSVVREEDIVAVIETDKVTVDVRATQSGVVTEILTSVGDEVKIRQPLYSVNIDRAEPPAAGSQQEQEERRWTLRRADRLNQEKMAAQRIWEKHQQERRSRRGTGNFESEWRWQTSARARQTGPSAEASSWTQPTKFRTSA